jgi:NAD(P)H-dependent flavin oxidoreductase YrpB (nitropropane dioxygenase family)
MKRIKQTGAVVLSSATTVAEARALEAEGADAIIAQGLEAGGHRGTFTQGDGAGLIGTMALVPQVVDAVSVPVIAAGGIADGRGIAAAFALGASGVQIGTAFLGCPEATVPQIHRDALHDAADEDTRLTRVFTGRPARALRNRLIDEMGDAEALEFPAQASLTRAVAGEQRCGTSSVHAPLGGPGRVVDPRSTCGNLYRYAGDGDSETVAKPLARCRRMATHFRYRQRNSPLRRTAALRHKRPLAGSRSNFRFTPES